MGVRRTAAATLGALLLTGCATAGGGSSAVVTLAKADGWRPGLSPMPAFGVLEIAYDAATAERLWADNVPAALPGRDGDPAAPGRHGDLAGVDLHTHVVAVWSSGQSGTCPEWVSSISTDAAGAVVITPTRDGDSCTDDYNPYRAVLAVERDELPARTDLGDVTGVVSSGAVELKALVVEYPPG